MRRPLDGVTAGAGCPAVKGGAPRRPGEEPWGPAAHNAAPHGWARRALAITALCLVTAAAVAQLPSYLPPGAPETGGLRDLVLIYHGSKSRVAWTKDAIKPYVAYVDEQGEPRDWFFDSFLFIEFATDDGTWVHHCREGHRLPTVADWQWLAESWFRETTGLAGLEGAVAEVAAKLGPADKRVPVVITLPVPLTQDHAFGPLPGETTTLDFARPADRLKALEWYVGRVREQFQTRQYQHLQLLGFYWTDETLAGDNLELVKATSASLAARGLKHYWIPYFGAQGLDKWREAGFAAMMLQPNFFFSPERMSLQRFQTAAKVARRVGSGIELEFDGRALTDPEYRDRLTAYLEAGVAYGWRDEALLGYYEGGSAIKNFAETPGVGRELYDKVFAFVQGKYEPAGKLDFAPFALRLHDNSGDMALASKGGKVIGAPGRPEWGADIGPDKLIDGDVDFYGGMSGFGAFYIPSGFIIELPQVATVARTQVLLFDLDERFFRYRVDTSVDRETWSPAVDKDTGQWRGWQIDRFPPRPARCVRFTGLHNSANAIFQIVEFEVYGTP